MKTVSLALVMFFVPSLFGGEFCTRLEWQENTNRYGGWEGHEPVKFVGILYPWLLSEGAVVDTCSSLDIYTDKEFMKTVDLVIQVFTMSEITTAQEEGLLEAVRNGTGLAGWHGGLADLSAAGGEPGSSGRRYRLYR
jgi:type 1 glutamine amidotransferase